jgi:hypothetical protein
MLDFMTTPSNTDNETMVPCKLCSNQVWIRKDRLQAHIQKVHSLKAAPKTKFTTYKARIASTFPPKVVTKSTVAKQTGKTRGAADIILTTRAGRRAGKGLCAECGLEQLTLWHYSESNLGPVDICSECKANVFDRSFGQASDS